MIFSFTFLSRFPLVFFISFSYIAHSLLPYFLYANLSYFLISIFNFWFSGPGPPCEDYKGV